MIRFERVGGWFCAVAAALVLMPAWLRAADTAKAADAVDLFAAIESKQIEARLIPKDSTECNVLVTNRTAGPLAVRPPPAFAAAPVLAQLWPPDQNNKREQPQPLGVAPLENNRRQRGPLNVKQPNQLNWPPLWNIPPEKVVKFELPAVCLKYGAPNPRPQIPYEIKPLESVTDAPGAAEVCAMLGCGEIEQKIAQLAVWHLVDGLSWEKLSERRQKTAFGTRPTYSKKEIQSAKEVVEKAVEQAKRHGKSLADSR